MAAVSPFRGWRFNPETVGDMASVLCPPYDMIDEETQEALKRQNQYNVIHLEAGEGLDWNTSAKEQYAAAADLFDQWRQNEVLLEDAEPCYYLMRHSFPIAGKTMTASAGDAVYIPANTEHSARVVGAKESVIAVQIYAGPGPEQRFTKGKKVPPVASP